MSPRKNIYIPKDKQGTVEKAQELMGKDTISSTIIASLEAMIKRKEDENKGIAEYILTEGNRKAKVIGRKIAEYGNQIEYTLGFDEEGKILPVPRPYLSTYEEGLGSWTRWDLSAFITKSGKFVIHARGFCNRLLNEYDPQEGPLEGRQDLLKDGYSKYDEDAGSFVWTWNSAQDFLKEAPTLQNLGYCFSDLEDEDGKCRYWIYPKEFIEQIENAVNEPEYRIID